MSPVEEQPPRTADPEATCQRCSRPNVWSWHVPSPLWNAVMRDPATGEDRFGIVCPPCFAELAEGSGVVPPERHTWHFGPHDVDIASLWTDADGRIWDDEQCLWVAAIPSPSSGLDVEHDHEILGLMPADSLMDGRDFYVGRLTAPVEGHPHETHCLHVTTPLKGPVVFAITEWDLAYVAAMAEVVNGGPLNPRWVTRRAEAFRLAAMTKVQP